MKLDCVVGVKSYKEDIQYDKRNHFCPLIIIDWIHGCTIGCGPILTYFSGQKLDFKIFSFSPIIKSMISLYNLKKGGEARFFTGKFNFFGSGLIYGIYSHVIYMDSPRGEPLAPRTRRSLDVGRAASRHSTQHSPYN